MSNLDNRTMVVRELSNMEDEQLLRWLLNELENTRLLNISGDIVYDELEALDIDTVRQILIDMTKNAECCDIIFENLADLSEDDLLASNQIYPYVGLVALVSTLVDFAIMKPAANDLPEASIIHMPQKASSSTKPNASIGFFNYTINTTHPKQTANLQTSFSLLENFFCNCHSNLTMLGMLALTHQKNQQLLQQISCRMVYEIKQDYPNPSLKPTPMLVY